jgi:hypothetical protein
MLRFQGKNINSEFDLLMVKAQAIDFIRPLKFEKIDSDKLTNLIYEVTKKLIFNQVDCYICLNYYKQERRKGLEVYVYNKSMTIKKAKENLNNNTEFLDKFDLTQDPKAGIEVRLLKWSKGRGEALLKGSNKNV